jgi:hypothetical protein
MAKGAWRTLTYMHDANVCTWVAQKRLQDCQGNPERFWVWVGPHQALCCCGAHSMEGLCQGKYHSCFNM